MSEYMTVEPQATDDPDVLELVTNQTLTQAEQEVYNNFDEGDDGTPIAQMLFYGIHSIAALTITEHSLFITRETGVSWEEIVDEVRDALRDFFL